MSLLQFQAGSPVREPGYTGSSSETVSEPPEVKWHRTMKIAIDRAPLLTAGATESRSTALRLERYAPEYMHGGLMVCWTARSLSGLFLLRTKD